MGIRRTYFRGCALPLLLGVRTHARTHTVGRVWYLDRKSDTLFRSKEWLRFWASSPPLRTLYLVRVNRVFDSDQSRIIQIAQDECVCVCVCLCDGLDECGVGSIYGRDIIRSETRYSAYKECMGNEARTRKTCGEKNSRCFRYEWVNRTFLGCTNTPFKNKIVITKTGSVRVNCSGWS